MALIQSELKAVYVSKMMKKKNLNTYIWNLAIIHVWCFVWLQLQYKFIWLMQTSLLELEGGGNKDQYGDAKHEQ